MRDTLLLVLAAIGGTSVVLTACVLMWVAGNACVDWYDRMLTNREYAAKVDRVASTWQSRPMTAPAAQWSDEIHPHKHTVVIYDSLDDFHADVRIELELRAARRAGARGESDG